MLHRPIFTEKYLNAKLKGFSLDTIQDLEEKRKILHRWIKSINSGRIGKTKEKSIQGDFLNYIFGDVLDYDYSDPKSWNLAKEHTLMNGKMADGALGYFRMKGDQVESDVRAVIELKDANTDLDKPQNRKDDKRSPVEQAFSYASKAGGNCKWVIVSNFKEIRLYHSSDQGRYELFNLPNLPENNNLLRFFLLLKKDHLIAEKGESFVDRLHKERQEEEEKISRDFYDTYKEKRLLLFRHLKDKNPETDELLVFNKTQKLIDRLIFVFFCEDISLLPPYTIQQIRDIVSSSFDMSNTKVWRQLKGLFHSINVGNTKQNINKFNGGLFEKDDTLDNLLLEDETLLDVLKLADYDFSSDLNVNILGHIFEQSISDIEEIKADIKGEPYDRKSGKRKKEGIFYTPEYITRYIVKEAVGGWLEDRRQELGYYDLPELQEEDYNSIQTTKKKGKLRASANVKKHVAFWEQYREQLSNIKVLDPACGSGAFLNQVFDYLYAEGQKVNRELSRLKGGLYTVFDLDKHILTNNIFGVDLNRESVEITKLSLWLKTASKQKQLTALDKNIRCGNSLIDDPEMAGDEAFNWEENFPEIMENGGFDVVVGNPPYVFAREKIGVSEKTYYTTHYNSAQYQLNTYLLFIEASIKLLKENGLLGLIVPNAWLMVSSAQKLREYLLNHTKIKKIVNLAGESFEGVNVETIILNAEKTRENHHVTEIYVNDGNKFELSHTIEQREFENNPGKEFYVFADNKSQKVLEKIRKNTVNLDSIATIKAGLQAYEAGKGNPKQTKEDVKNRPYDFTYKYDDQTYKYLDGRNVNRYCLEWTGSWLKYGDHLAAPRTFDIFKNEKIIIREITGKFPRSILATYSDDIYLFNRSNIAINPKENSDISLKYLLAVINSTIMSFYFLKQTAKSVRQMFPKLILEDLRKFPIKEINKKQQKPFIEKADQMLELNHEFIESKNKLLSLLKSDFELNKISKKLNSWYEFDWKEFEKELKKQKLTLKGETKEDWYDRFNRFQEQATQIQGKINQTDREIDRMVYELYGLTDEEIELIENEK